MKAYIIKIELLESDPPIWRRVIMPAGATFKRLHDIIQNVTNFQSGYPFEGYHIYEFDLSQDNKRVTDDEAAYEEHQHYKKHKTMYVERLRTILPKMLEFEKNYQERIKIEVRKATGLKIDKYLETYGQLSYTYDPGENWRFSITLEEIVDDYYFGFPTLLAGAETAPPEDVGGIRKFYEFMEIYKDQHRIEYKRIKEWAESVYFREYDPEAINTSLKGIQYKKTEWDKINHEQYKIIEDKYRGNGI